MSEQNPERQSYVSRTFKRASGYETYAKVLHRLDRYPVPTLVKQLAANVARTGSFLAPANARYFNERWYDRKSGRPIFFYTPGTLIADFVNLELTNVAIHIAIIGEAKFGMLNESNPPILNFGLAALDFIGLKLGANILSHITLDKLEKRFARQ